MVAECVGTYGRVLGVRALFCATPAGTSAAPFPLRSMLPGWGTSGLYMGFSSSTLTFCNP